MTTQNSTTSTPSGRFMTPEASSGGPDACGGPAGLDPVQLLYAAKGNSAATVDNSASQVERTLAQIGVSLPCSRPITLRNDAGETVSVRCRTRRAADCLSCSALYSGDASAILRAGTLDAGPGHVIVMLTLTAPSFGPVHRVPKPTASPRLSATAQRAWRTRAARSRCRCGVRHEPGDRLAGVPLDVVTYDYERQTAWNAATGRLWNRTSTLLARRLGLAERLAYAGTAEMQRRGCVHQHLLVRLAASSSLGLQRDSSGRLRSSVIEATVRYASTTVAGQSVQWGQQVVAEVIAGPGIDGLHARRTLGYIVKAVRYTVKDLGAGIDDQASEHLQWCGEAASVMDCPACDDGDRVASCRSPRHRSLGYPGHALRKSRSWSPVIFRTLREHRQEWARDHLDVDTIDGIDSQTWEFVRMGHDHTANNFRAALSGEPVAPPPLTVTELAPVVDPAAFCVAWLARMRGTLL